MTLTSLDHPCSIRPQGKDAREWFAKPPARKLGGFVMRRWGYAPAGICADVDEWIGLGGLRARRRYSR